MNTIVRILDMNWIKVVSEICDVFTAWVATGEAIYAVIDDKLSELLDTPNPWNPCTSVGNPCTSGNIVKHNSLKARVVQRNPSAFLNVCPCHMIHDATQKASEAFSRHCGFDMEDFTRSILLVWEVNEKEKLSSVILWILWPRVRAIISKFPLGG